MASLLHDFFATSLPGVLTTTGELFQVDGAGDTFLLDLANVTSQQRYEQAMDEDVTHKGLLVRADLASPPRKGQMLVRVGDGKKFRVLQVPDLQDDPTIEVLLSADAA